MLHVFFNHMLHCNYYCLILFLKDNIKIHRSYYLLVIYNKFLSNAAITRDLKALKWGNVEKNNVIKFQVLSDDIFYDE